MRRVLLESPYAGEIPRNLMYARACMADCFRRGEAPFASHLLYTQSGILDDTKPAERRQGMEAGFLWGAAADTTVVYTDLGVTDGMVTGIADANASGRKIEYRKLPDWENDFPKR